MVHTLPDALPLPSPNPFPPPRPALLQRHGSHLQLGWIMAARSHLMARDMTIVW